MNRHTCIDHVVQQLCVTAVVMVAVIWSPRSQDDRCCITLNVATGSILALKGARAMPSMARQVHV